jgi:hypothetical protein
MEPVGQNVEQEAPDEFAGRERHRAKPLAAKAWRPRRPSSSPMNTSRPNAAAAGHPTQRGQPRLALDQRQRADIVAVETQKVEDEETNPAALPASDAAWIMPSGKSPSR